MSKAGEERAAKLHARLVEYARSSSRFAHVVLTIVDDFFDRWRAGKMITLPDRIECPACGMRGASFVPCSECGGPACDNCCNMTRASLCAACKGKEEK